MEREHPGKPIRPPASANLLIDSEDRYATADDRVRNAASNPGNDFIVSKPQALLYGHFTRVGVSQIQLQYRVPSIVAGVNDTFLLYDVTNANYYQVTIPQGYYSATSLAAAIQTAVLALPSNPFTAFTCQYSALDGGFVMTNSAVDLALAYVTGTPYTAAQAAVWSRTFTTIGGSQSNLAIFQPAPTQTIELGTPQLLFTKYIDVVSDRLAKYQRVKDADTLPTNKSNIVARVYLTAPNTRVDPTASGGPFDLVWSPQTIKLSSWSPAEAIFELDFRLFDEFGELLFWTPSSNTEFQLSVLASET